MSHPATMIGRTSTPRVRVHSLPPGWLYWEAACSDCGDVVMTSDWLAAMECAWGHIAMKHGRR